MRAQGMRRSQSGALLLEALVALLIFSFGILGIVGLQAAVVAQSSDARYRSDAALLASSLIGTMWAADRTVGTLQQRFNTCTTTTCDGYIAWRNQVVARLPGVVAGTSTAPSVNVDDSGVVTVTVFWRVPSGPAETSTHRYNLTAQVR